MPLTCPVSAMMPTSTSLSQEELCSICQREFAQKSRPFIKDLPILLLPTIGLSKDALAADILGKLNDVDAATFAESAAVSLQFTREGEPNFYLIGADVYKDLYKQVKLEEVTLKNSELWAAASHYFQDGFPPGTTAGLKLGFVEMVSTTDLGFPKSEELTIRAPWGQQQTKEAGDEAWIVKENENKFLHGEHKW